MKVLAIIDVVAGADMERVRANIPDELKESWVLFASGILREAYATAKPTRVLFVLEAENAAQAYEHLRKLPLVASGQLTVELVELRPFVHWSMLFAR